MELTQDDKELFGQFAKLYTEQWQLFAQTFIVGHYIAFAKDPESGRRVISYEIERAQCAIQGYQSELHKRMPSPELASIVRRYLP